MAKDTPEDNEIAPTGPPVSKQASEDFEAGLKSRDAEFDEKLKSDREKSGLPEVPASTYGGSDLGEDDAPIHKPIGSSPKAEVTPGGSDLSEDDAPIHNPKAEVTPGGIASDVPLPTAPLSDEESEKRKQFSDGLKARDDEYNRKQKELQDLSDHAAASPTAMSEGTPSEPDEDLRELDDDTSSVLSDDNISVGAYAPDGATVHGDAAGQPDNKSQIILPSGHVIDLVTSGGQKYITIPSTNGLSLNQKMEVARGMIAAAIAEGCYTTQSDGSFMFKIETDDFQLRAAMEAQVESLGHKYVASQPSNAEQKIKAHYKELYPIFIAEIKDAVVKDNIKYCDDVENAVCDQENGLTVYDLEKELTELKAELTERKLQLSSDEIRGPEGREMLKKNISELEKNINGIEKTIKTTVKSKIAEIENSPDKNKKSTEGFHRKYLGGLPGEKADPVRVKMREEKLNQKAGWFGRDRAYRVFKKNFKKSHAAALANDPTYDLSNLKPEDQEKGILKQVIEGGIYREEFQVRAPLLDAIDSGKPKEIVDKARKLGERREAAAEKLKAGAGAPIKPGAKADPAPIQSGPESKGRAPAAKK